MEEMGLGSCQTKRFLSGSLDETNAQELQQIDPITSKIGHKNLKERKYFRNQTEIKLKYFQQAIIMVT